MGNGYPVIRVVVLWRKDALSEFELTLMVNLHRQSSHRNVIA